MPDRQWHLEKSFNIGHLLTTIVMITTAIWWTARIENMNSETRLRQEHLQQQQDLLRSQVEVWRIESDNKRQAMRAEVGSQLLRIEEKIDRLTEIIYKRESQ